MATRKKPVELELTDDGRIISQSWWDQVSRQVDAEIAQGLHPNQNSDQPAATHRYLLIASRAGGSGVGFKRRPSPPTGPPA